MRALRERRPCLPQRRRRARCAPYGNEGRANPSAEGAHDAPYGNEGRACVRAEGAHDARPTGTKAVPVAAQKARTMRALREQRPCQPRRRRRARCAPYGNEGRACLSAEGAHDARPTGKAVPVATSEAHASRANPHVILCHEACATGVAAETAFFYGVWGGSPSGGVQRAGVRPLPQGTGARSPRLIALTRGAGARGAHPRAAHAAQRML